jgi:hypothetical protein
MLAGKHLELWEPSFGMRYTILVPTVPRKSHQVVTLQ